MNHPPDAGKMVCAHEPDPGQVRLYGFKGSQATRCLRCDAKLRRVKCEACNGSGFGPWRDAI